ncbi:MAG: S8 family serine peptidase, partial [Gammaproteobacteria bacterium]
MKWAAMCAAALLLLGGCGGNGSSAPPTAQAPPPPDKQMPPPPKKQEPPPPAPKKQPPPTTITTPTTLTVPLTPLTPAAQLPPATTMPLVSFAEKKKVFEAAPEYMVKWSGVNVRTGEPVSGTDNHLALINASAAYARGATGEGEVVAVTDSGIYNLHHEFRIRDEEGNIIGNKIPSSAITQWENWCRRETGATVCGPYSPRVFRDVNDKIIGDERRHGTSVAALIVGARDGLGVIGNMQGVAYKATLRFHQIYLGGGGGGGYKPTDITKITETDDMNIAARYFSLDHARAGGAFILNHSFGASGYIDLYDGAEIKKRFKHTAALLEQAGVDPADKIIVVRSAGNAGNACLNAACDMGGVRVNPKSVELWSGLGVHFPELRSHVLAVVAVGQDGILADFSNPCGLAKSFCLAAPGVGLWTAYTRSPFDYRTFGGTSAAAPVVSGSLALLRQYFRRQLGSTELVSRLLQTADKTGIYADSDKYGQGMLDLDAATAPMGTLMTALSGDPLARPFTGGGFTQSGGAFGAAMENALGGVEIAAFDQLDAPFFFMLADGIAHAPRLPGQLREHEIALGSGISQLASLSLQTEGNALAAARIRRGDWWFAYGHHGGREAGLYAGGIGAGGGVGAGRNVRANGAGLGMGG